MSFGSACYGYSASIISTTLAPPSFITYFEAGTRADATRLESTVTGLYQVGSFQGASASAASPTVTGESCDPKCRKVAVRSRRVDEKR